MISTSTLHSDMYVSFPQTQYKICQYKEELLSLSFLLNIFANDKAFKRPIFLINFLFQPYFTSFVNHICFLYFGSFAVILLFGKK